MKTPVPRTSAVLDRVKLLESVSPKEGKKSDGTAQINQGKKQKQAAIVKNDDWKKRNNGWRNVFATPSLKIDAATFTPPSYPKTESQVELISSSFEQSYLLKNLCKQQDANGSAHSKLLNAMEPLQVSKGEVIEQQGQMGGHFYIVEEGQVDFQVDGIVVGTAAQGSSFGHVNLLHSAPSKSSVVARNKTKLLRVDRATYRGIMQTSTQSLPEMIPTPPPVLEMVESLWDEERSSAIQRLNEIRSFVTANVALDDLERISVLGEGQFGEVWLCQATIQTSMEKFALKIQPKVNESQGEEAENAIRKEIATMQALHHPFLAHLVHDYEDNENMYMLMGLIPGGELWELIHKQDDAGDWTSGIPESHAKFYALVMADALAYMHSKQFIFRDLKPENVMIDADGYPLLVDFGLSKQLGSDEKFKTFTFCGTPNYVSPEIVQSVGYGFGIDHWALGVIIYEMIAGENPFYFHEMSESELYQAICEEEHYPLKCKEKGTALGGPLVDLINKLLEKDPTLRMGMLTGDEMDLFQHAWFDGLDLAKIRSKQMPAPWIPGNRTSKEETTVDLPEGPSRQDENPSKTTSLLCAASSDEALNDGHRTSLVNTISDTSAPNEQGDGLISIAAIKKNPKEGHDDDVNAWDYNDFDCDFRHELRPDGLFAPAAKAHRSWKVKG
jgi:serine/threonine protein kinase